MKVDQLTLESMGEAGRYNLWILKQFSQYLKGDILEVGCGIGNFTQYLVDFGQVWTFDSNKSYINKLKKKFTNVVNIGVGDIEKGIYFFDNKKFDSIVCLNVIEHIKDDTKSLINLNKLLKKGGCLILLVPSHQLFFGKIDESIGHFRRYDKASLAVLLKNSGFKIILIKRLNLLGALGWFIAGKVLKDESVKKGRMKIFNIIAPLFLFIEKFFEPPLGISVLTIAKK